MMMCQGERWQDKKKLFLFDMVWYFSAMAAVIIGFIILFTTTNAIDHTGKQRSCVIFTENLSEHPCLEK